MPDELIFPTVGTAVTGYIRATGQSWTDWEDEGTAPPGDAGDEAGGEAGAGLPR